MMKTTRECAHEHDFTYNNKMRSYTDLIRRDVIRSCVLLHVLAFCCAPKVQNSA